MKSAKLMLLSLIVFAFFGGSLAFGSKAFWGKLCVGTANGVNVDVPTYSGPHKFTSNAQAPVLLYRSTNADGDKITVAEDCIDLTTTTTSSTRITSEP